MAYGMQNLRPRNLFNNYDQLTPQYGGNGGMQDDPFFNSPTPPPEESYNPYDPNQAPGTPGRGVDASMTAPPPPPPQVQQQPRDPYQGVTLDDQLKAINSVYTPDYTSRDRHNRLLDSYPGEYSPTKSDRWSAVLLGLGAGGEKGGDVQGTMDKILQAPRMRDIEDWKNKAPEFGKAAQFENTANATERQMASSLVNAQTQAERNRIQEQYNQDRTENTRIRNEAYAAKISGATVTIDKGSGQIVATWNDGRPPKFLGKVPGSSTAAQLADIEGKWDEKAATARATGTMENTIAQGYRVWEDTAGNKYLVNERGPNKTPIPVQGSPATPEGGITPYERPLPDRPAENLTPAQKAEAQQNEVQSYYDRAPADVRKLFRGSGKTLKLGPRPADTWTGWGQAEREKEQQLWDKTQQEMFGQQKGIGPSGQAAPPKVENKPIAPDIPNPSGKDVYIPKDTGAQPTPPRPIDVAKAAREKAAKAKSDIQKGNEWARRQPTPKGQIRVRAKDGREGFVDSKWTEADLAAEGYTRIK